MLNIRGLSGNSGSHPFYDCECSQANRNLPRTERAPCQIRTIQSCIDNHLKWKSETGSDKSKVSKYKNCLNEPLLQKSFSDAQFNLPILHITVGLGAHDVAKLEDELLKFDESKAIQFLQPTKNPAKKGVFWTFINYG